VLFCQIRRLFQEVSLAQERIYAVKEIFEISHHRMIITGLSGYFYLFQYISLKLILIGFAALVEIAGNW
jgi:hypothetical protein